MNREKTSGRGRNKRANRNKGAPGGTLIFVQIFRGTRLPPLRVFQAPTARKLADEQEEEAEEEHEDDAG